MFPDSASTKVISEVYIVCGYPKAGKTDWINRHSPARPGVALYIEGTNHSKAIRSFLIGRLRKLTSESIACVWVNATAEIAKERCRKSYQGVAYLEREDEILTVQRDQEIVDLQEGFDLIYPIGQRI